MLPDFAFLLSVILMAAFVVIQLGKTRRGGVIPLVAGIGAAGFSYSRYSQFSGDLGQLGGTFDTQVTYLQYFWIGSMLLWMVIAGWGLVRVLSSAHLSGVAGGLRERVRAVTAPPTADEEVVNMERGIIPTLKGAGAGALGGGLIAGVPLLLLAVFFGGSGEGAAWGVLFAISAAAIGASVGAVAGGVTANTTTSKGEGAKLGAGVGAATGAIGMVALSMKPGHFFDVSLLVGVAALGAVAGAAAGFSGSVVAKHERDLPQ
jgi:hypothetical protein